MVGQMEDLKTTDPQTELKIIQMVLLMTKEQYTRNALYFVCSQHSFIDNIIGTGFFLHAKIK